MSSPQKKAICLYFEVHQPFRLRRYRFFDIGHEHYYYDDYTNESILRKIAENCYLPANKIMLDLINKNKGKFRVTFSLTGIVIDQFRLYAPEVLESFRELAKTGCVEFLAETNSHSLASLKNRELFMRQVSLHRDKMVEFLGVEPQSIRNTELIYSDEIGNWMADLGFKATVTEGAKHILGWKSPNYLYCNAINPRLKVLLRNYSMSDDIAFRFSNQGWSGFPLTAEKYASWVNEAGSSADIINIFMDYETFGEHQKKETGIFGFLRHFPEAILKKTPFTFMTVSEVADKLQPVSVLHVPSPISWADEERDLTAWMGNDLQNAAVEKLYSLSERVSRSGSEPLMRDWIYLQSSDHFYYMSTKFFSDGDVHAYFNPYENPYQAFLNYMNILSDFEIRLNSIVPASSPEVAIQNLNAGLEARDEIIAKLEEKVARLEKKKAPARKTEKGSGGELLTAAKKVTKALATDAPAEKKKASPAKPGKEKKTVKAAKAKPAAAGTIAATGKIAAKSKTATAKKTVRKKK